MELLEYAFFRHALLGCLLAAVLCGFIGTYIVSRRFVFISGGITHASFGGIGFGLYSGLPPMWCGAVFAVLSAFGVQWLSRRAEVREDSAIAVFWAFGMAVGVIFAFMSPSFTADLSTYLFGNVLTITTTDLWTLGILTGCVCLFFMLCMNAILSVAFDRGFAATQHVPVRMLEYAMMAWIALTIVACLRMVGIVMVISLLTLPQMTANLFTSDFRRLIAGSAGVGFVACAGGLWLSYYGSIPSGACIIFLSILMYALCKILKSVITLRISKKV